MIEQDFSNAKVGDRAWSARKGWGTIRRLTVDTPYPIEFKADMGDVENYTPEGKDFISDLYPTLFHQEPQIIIPEPPVTHEVDCFVNVYGNAAVTTHESPVDASESCYLRAYEVCGIPAKIVFQLPAGKAPENMRFSK